MSAPSFEQAVPILRIFDLAKTREFYVDYLGFAVDWEHRFAEDFPVYMQVSLGGCRLHLTEHHGGCCPGAALRIGVRGLEDFVSALKAKGYAYARPAVEKQPWGTLDAELIDPFGNRLTFSEPIEAS